MPNQYTVRTGAVMDVQDTTEPSTTLQVATQKGVDLNFTAVDLTLTIDQFSDRYIKPAMSVLAANIESDVLSNVYQDVYNQVNNINTAATHAKLVETEQMLWKMLAPDDNRSINLDGQTHADLLGAFKALFHEGKEIASEFKTAKIGHAMGLDFYRNTLLPVHTSGSDDGTADYKVNGADQTGSSVTIDTGSGTFLAGDILTFAGCNRVHPETKVDTGVLQQFVVTADTGTSATSVSISPSIITSGATQNVSASPTTTGDVTKIGGASETYPISLAYHKEAFTFATADLRMPRGVDFSAREVLDGISMRIVQDYDINNDNFPCRVDVLYGYKTIRAELATRWANN